MLQSGRLGISVVRQQVQAERGGETGGTSGGCPTQQPSPRSDPRACIASSRLLDLVNPPPPSPLPRRPPALVTVLDVVMPADKCVLGGRPETASAKASSWVHAPVGPSEVCCLCLLCCVCSQMRVEWTTRDSGNPVVKWGTASGDYSHTSAASSGSYTAKDICGPPANSIGWTEPGTFHSVVLDGLEPGRRYYYVVGDEVSKCYLVWTDLLSGESIHLSSPPPKLTFKAHAGCCA